MRRSRMIALVLCAALLISSLASCTVISSTAEEKKTVMTVGGYDVPYELYYYISENLKADMPEACADTIEAEVFEIIKEIYAVFSLGEDFGIAFDDKYISSVADDAAALAIEECGSKKAYKKALAESNMNDSVFRFLERHSKTADELLSAITDSGKYPKGKENIIALAGGEEFVCVKQILVMSENSISTVEDTYFSTGETHTEEEALAIAEKAQKRAAQGEDFDMLVKEYGESLYMFNNTDGYYVCRGMWEEVNEEAVFSLQIGEVSQVIKSESGYSIFLRCEKSADYIEGHTDTIANDYYRAQYNILLEERIDELEITTNELYDSYRNGEKAN